jgi:hypothetical protein
MAYFNHAFKKVFIATKPSQGQSGGFDAEGAAGENAGVVDGVLVSTGVHVSKLKSTAASEGFQLGVGTLGIFDAKTDRSIDTTELENGCCPFYFAGASIKLNDKQGPQHGGYQESHKSKVINPKYVRKGWIAVANPATAAFVQVGATPDNLADASCAKEFLCGETYYLRVEVKGTAALRFANHNLYQTLQADGGCCDDPSNPTPVAENGLDVYKQWAVAIAENPYLKDFIRPILVVDGDSYAYDEASAVAAGLDPSKVFSAVTTSATAVGLILQGAYVDTTFGDCTFQTSDYYGKEPIQIYASEVDYNGDPCTFDGICVVETCPGVQANGLGEEKVRELLLSESYLQNFMHSDLRIREITQGTRAYEVLDRQAQYDSVFLLHSVPRFSNPSGVFDNDQYLIEIIAPEGDASAVLDIVTKTLECAGCEKLDEYANKTADECIKASELPVA